ncbi:hypothetical protein K443DRAFT_28966, partial [Laccaria amethystina LaAM-08-1]
TTASHHERTEVSPPPTTYLSDTEFRCHVADSDVATKQRLTFVNRCRCIFSDKMVSTAHRTFVPSHLTEMQYNGGTTIWDNDDATRRTQYPSDTMTTP